MSLSTGVLTGAFPVPQVITDYLQVDKEEINMRSQLTHVVPGHMQACLSGYMNIFSPQQLQQWYEAVGVLQERVAAAQGHPAAGGVVIIRHCSTELYSSLS